MEALGYRYIERAAASDLPRAIEDCNAGLKLSPYDGKSLRGRAHRPQKEVAVKDRRQAIVRYEAYLLSRAR